MEGKNRWGMVFGAFLIVLGILFLMGQYLNVNVWLFVWPLILLGVGAAFFAGMVTGGKAAGGLAVPGSIFTMFGLITLVQNLVGSWTTWAYAWTLLIVAVGAGLLIMSYWSRQPELLPVGRGLLIGGLALFLFFGVIFELGALLLGARDAAGIFWPVVLILAGLYVMFGRQLFRGAGQALERSAQRNAALVDMPTDLGNGLPVRAEDVRGVRCVQFRGMGDMTIHQGEREGLEIQASHPLRERVRTRMQGETLDISMGLEWWEWLNPVYWGPQPVRYHLYVRQLDVLKASGVGRTTIPQLLVPRLEVDQSGAGEINIHGLETGTLVVRLSGVGSTEIKGRTDHQEAVIAGVGSYRGEGLQSRTAVVTLSGVGSADVWVTETLDAHLSGTGNISYKGSPQVKAARTGIGNIQSKGAY